MPEEGITLYNIFHMLLWSSIKYKVKGKSLRVCIACVHLLAHANMYIIL